MPSTDAGSRMRFACSTTSSVDTTLRGRAISEPPGLRAGVGTNLPVRAPPTGEGLIAQWREPPGVGVGDRVCDIGREVQYGLLVRLDQERCVRGGIAPDEVVDGHLSDVPAVSHRQVVAEHWALVALRA